MARISKEEQRAKHLNELNRTRLQRYRENHAGEIKTLKAEISVELYDKVDAALKEQGITKKEFIENAIDQFLKARG